MRSTLSPNNWVRVRQACAPRSTSQPHRTVVDALAGRYMEIQPSYRLNFVTNVFATVNTSRQLFESTSTSTGNFQSDPHTVRDIPLVEYKMQPLFLSNCNNALIVQRNASHEDMICASKRFVSLAVQTAANVVQSLGAPHHRDIRALKRGVCASGRCGMAQRASKQRATGLHISPHFSHGGDRTTPVSTKGGTGNKQLTSRSGTSTRENGLLSLRPSPECDLFELLMSDKGVCVIDHIAMFLTEGTNKTRDVEPAIAGWQGGPVAWCGGTPKSAGQAQLGTRHIDKDTVDAGKRVEGSITPFVLPREVRLGNFHRAGGNAARRAAARLASPSLEVRLKGLNCSLVQITNVEVAHEEANPVRVRWPASSRSAETAGGVPVTCRPAGREDLLSCTLQSDRRLLTR